MSNNRTSWQGECVEYGAQRTFIGQRKAKAYRRYTGNKFRLTPDHKCYSFGDDRQSSLDSLAILLPFSNTHAVYQQVDVVISDAPLLLGTDLLDNYSMFVNTISNHLHCPELQLTIPFFAKTAMATLNVQEVGPYSSLLWN